MADDGCHSHQSTSPCSRSPRRKPRHGSDKRGLNSKIHLAVDANGLPLRILITGGPVADCTQAESLIDGLSANYLLADRGYDSDEIIAQAQSQGMNPVIPPRKNRIVQRKYNRTLYKRRHLVENAVLKLKQWRGIATRYAKTTASFLAAVQIRCLMVWLLSRVDRV